MILHPTVAQTSPGIQHPPPMSLAQGVLPATHEIVPVQVYPAGQHPIVPIPVSVTVTQVSPVAQHRLGALEQAEVPAGHSNCLFSNSARAAAAAFLPLFIRPTARA